MWRFMLFPARPRLGGQSSRWVRSGLEKPFPELTLHSLQRRSHRWDRENGAASSNSCSCSLAASA